MPRVLPEDERRLVERLQAIGVDATYIVKIRTGSSGKGAEVMHGDELSRRLTEVAREPEGRVVQRHAMDPHLADGKKTDLRVYAMVFFDPLVVYLHPDGNVNVAQKP
jgi:hypothetical protein